MTVVSTKEFKKRAQIKNNIQYFALIALVFFLTLPITIWADEGDVLWKKNFGGSRNDQFATVTAVPNGIVAVGFAEFGSFGSGDWKEITGKGNLDAIIVKYDNNGNIVWKKNFGGSGEDRFESVTAVADGVVAVGYSDFSSFGNGDWEDFERKGYQDATIVKYDNDGNIVWKHNLGGKSSGYSKYLSVTTLPDGIVAVGYSDGFGAGDWEEIAGNGNYDAIMVKYDCDGNIIWKTNFGGSDVDRFFSVTPANDGIVAAGVSFAGSFGNENWETDTCKGDNDAIVVKFDDDGSVVWKKNFGGRSDDCFYSVTTVSDGFVAAGFSYPGSFGNGNWAIDTCRGWEDAIIVKYDNDGEVVWKKNFGGGGFDCFYDIATVPNGMVAVGTSETFESGDWYGVKGKGGNDAIIVMFDNEGNVKWKENFGGSDRDSYNSITILPGAIVVAGYSNYNSFNSGDWTAITGNGWEDAIIVKYAAEEVGINQPSQELSKIEVYPNPTTGELRISLAGGGLRGWNNGELRIENVEIFDVYGRKLNHLITSSSNHLINISHLPAGVYFLKAGLQTIKIVKQ